MRLDDLELVRGWLTQPHVARWFLAGTTLEAELESLRACVVGTEPTDAFIVERTGPIGWCQWYRCRDYPDFARDIDAAPDDIGIDYAIGDLSETGHGVGTALIEQMVHEIRRRHPTAAIIADPEAANVASRRVLEKNGFALLGERMIASEPIDDPMAIYRYTAGGLDTANRSRE